MIPMTMHEADSYYEHVPVLLRESIDELITDRNGIYVDGTLGGGGHAMEILSRLSTNGRLIGIDQDDEALKAAQAHIGSDPRFSTIKGNFGYLSRLISPELHGEISGILLDLGVSTHQISHPERGLEISGILLDLGVSTHQISHPERGFSFQKDGPLDMRMSNLRGVTAWQVVNEYPYEDLRDVIFHYGEERMSRKIARAIIDARPLETTGELREVITSVVKGQHQVKSIARVFQGIRIEVNRELDMLREVLLQALDVLSVGGRIVAISYHSLEDRIVKRFFRTGNHQGKVEKDFYGNDLSPMRTLSRGIITPGEEEIKRNPAARSAKMRVGEKIDAGEV